MLGVAGLILVVWAWRAVEESKRHAVWLAREERDQMRQAKTNADEQLEQALAARQAADVLRSLAAAAEKAARHHAQVAEEVLDFLREGVLSPGSPDGWKSITGHGEVTLRQVVDAAAPKVDDAFVDQPLAEASVRKILGAIYLDLSDAKRAIQQDERALALLEAELGLDHPDTSDCRNQLAVAYRRADREDKAGRLFEQAPLSSTRAAALTMQGSALLAEGKPAEAELKLRESLQIRRRLQPEAWTTFDAQSMLGEALLEQRKYAAAERSLLLGYHGLSRRQTELPTKDRRPLDQARQRLVRLYQAWGKSDETAKWLMKSSSPQAPGANR